MFPFRPGAPRPQALVDSWGFGLADPQTGSVVGRAARRGRERLVAALPLANGPAAVTAPRALVDRYGFVLADPASGTVVGRAPVVVSRLLAAAATTATRDLL